MHSDNVTVCQPATTLSPLRVASGRVVKKYQQIRVRPSPLRVNVRRRLLAKIGSTSWSSLAYWALGWAKLLVYCIAYCTARMLLRAALALVRHKRQPLSGLWLLLNIDTLWILMVHVVTCPLPPSAVDQPLVLLYSMIKLVAQLVGPMPCLALTWIYHCFSFSSLETTYING